MIEMLVEMETDIQESFLLGLERRGLAPATKKVYRRAVEDLAKYLEAHSLTIQSLTPEQAGRACEDIGKGRGGSWKKQFLATMRFLFEEVVGQADPFGGISVSRVGSRTSAPDRDSIVFLLGKLRDSRRTYGDQLVYAMAMTIAETRCRYQDCAALTKTDLCWEDGVIVGLNICGRRFTSERLVDCLREWIQLLDLHLQARRLDAGKWNAFIDARLLFPSLTGSKFTNQAFNLHLKTVGRDLKLPKISSEHIRSLRKTRGLKKRLNTEIQEILAKGEGRQ